MNLLCDVVKAIERDINLTDADIEATIYYLIDEDVIQDVKTFRRIVKKLNKILEYEESCGG